MELTSRASTPEDHHWLRGVHHRAYRDVVERQYGAWVEAEQNRFFDAKWAERSAYEIVLCDGAPCGFVLIEDDSNLIHVVEIVIDPEFQSRGIGTRLLTGVLERAQTRRVPVRLRTARANRAAALYRRLGFCEVGTTPTHLLFEWQPDHAAES